MICNGGYTIRYRLSLFSHKAQTVRITPLSPRNLTIATTPSTRFLCIDCTFPEMLAKLELFEISHQEIEIFLRFWWFDLSNWRLLSENCVNMIGSDEVIRVLHLKTVLNFGWSPEGEWWCAIIPRILDTAKISCVDFIWNLHRWVLENKTQKVWINSMVWYMAKKLLFCTDNYMQSHPIVSYYTLKFALLIQHFFSVSVCHLCWNWMACMHDLKTPLLFWVSSGSHWRFISNNLQVRSTWK